MSTPEYFNPFPGLRPFRSDEDYLFFGREAQCDELLRRLRINRFLAVVGTSGSGKSSLVRAGLMPALYGGFMTNAGSRWRVAILRPGGDPIGSLARALNSPDVFGWEDADSDATIQTMLTETTLRRSALGLVEAVRLADMPANENLIVVVDQFEELFRFQDTGNAAEASDDAAAFVKLLLTASRADDVPIYVVLTMRSDYLGDCAQFRDLPEAINDGQYLIPQLTRSELRQAIVGPAAVGGKRIAPRLVQRLLNEAGENPDHLPVLQHALMRTWEKAVEVEADTLDVEQYKAIGGVQEALSRHADEVYNALPDDDSRRIAERVFKAITDKDLDNRGVRRPTRLQILCNVTDASLDEIRPIINAFRAPRRSFLMPAHAESLTPDSVIDISHESLMRIWRRLKGWVEEEAESAHMYRRVADTAHLYQEGKASLWRDPNLQLALNWHERVQPNAAWAARYDSNFDRAMAFLEESRDVREAERAEKEKQEREKQELEKTRIKAKERGRRIRMLGGAIVITAILAVAAVFLAFQSRQAQAAAEATRAELQSRNLAEDAVDALNEHDNTGLAVALALQANRIPNDMGITAPAQAQHALAQAAYASRIGRQFEYGAPVYSAAYSPEHGHLVSGGEDGSVTLWNLDTGTHETRVEHEGIVWSVAISPDGTRALSAGADGRMILWDLDTLDVVHRFEEVYDGAVFSVAFDPTDATRALSGGADTAVILWDLAARRPIRRLDEHADWVYAVAFGPQGKRVLSGSEDGDVLLWDADSGSVLKRLGAGDDDDVAGHTDWVRAVAFSPDGTQALSTSREMILWDLDTGTPIRTMKHDSDATMYSVAFSPDGTHALSASGRRVLNDESPDTPFGELILWDLEQGVQLTRLTDHDQQVRVVAFGADDETALSASLDGSLRLWDLAGGTQTHEFSADEPASMRAEAPPQECDPDAAEPNYGPIEVGAQVVVARPSPIDGDDSWAEEMEAYVGRTATVTDLWGSDSEGCPLVYIDIDSDPWPWRIRDLRLLSGTADAISLSPKGTYAVSDHGDNTLFLWDALGGRRLRVLDGHHAPITALAFDPKERHLISGDENGNVILWNTDTGTEERRLSGGVVDAVVAVALRQQESSDILRAFAVDAGGRIARWELEADKQPEVHEYGGDEIDSSNALSADVYPTGRYVVLGTERGDVVVWDLDTGEVIHTAEGDVTEDDTVAGHRGPVRSVAFSRDGRQLLSAGDEVIIHWSFRETEEDKPLKKESERKQAGEARSIAFVAEGKQALLGSRSGPLLWDFDTNDVAALMQGIEATTPSVERVASSGDGEQALLLLGDGSLLLWDVASARVLHRFEAGPTLATDAGGRIISHAADNHLIYWDRDTGEETRLSPPSERDLAPITSLTDIPGTAAVLSGHADGSIVRSDLETGRTTQYLDWHTGPVYSLAVAADGRHAVSGAADGSVFYWDLAVNARRKLYSFQHDTDPADSVLSVAINPDRTRALSAGLAGRLYLWDLNNGTEIARFDGGGDGILSIAFTPDGQRALSGSRDGTILLWDLSSSPPREIRRFAGNAGPVYDLAISPDGMQVLSGGDDMHLWSVGSGERITTFDHPAPVWRVAFAPDGMHAFSSAADFTVRGWRLLPPVTEMMAWTHDTAERYIQLLPCTEWKEQYNIEPAPEPCLTEAQATTPTPTPTPASTPTPSPRDQGPVQVGANMGTLGQNMPDVWTYSGRKGEVLRVRASAWRPASGIDSRDERLERARLDTTLTIRGPDDFEESSDDIDPGIDTDSLVSPLILPADGSYHIEVGSWEGVTSGAYTLTVGPVETRSLDAGTPVTGDIEDNTVWTFEGTAGQVVSIAMDEAGSDIDPYVSLIGPDGDEVAYNDDSEGLNARIDAVPLPETGTYMIIAEAYEASGRYTLSLDPVETRPIEAGAPVTGAIEDNDVWTFEGTAGEVVTIAMDEAGSGIDPYVSLIGPDGGEVAYNDDSEGLNARIDAVPLPETGTYMIIGGAYDVSGRYILSLEEE